jgi:hypothetical protein
MFIETVTAPRDEWEHWKERIGMLSNPPDALVALIAWEASDGYVTEVHVWDKPGAIADFFMEHVLPIIEVDGEPANKPLRHGEPLAFFCRR